ncbi:putative F-box domain-containing protein [Helianthus annuus]|nr:putative F-box domain-containing protein [Helianthus annuus]
MIHNNPLIYQKMSEHIPLAIQSEIMNRLPVKSLLQFRSICKPWKYLIESSDFIAHYSSQQQHLLVTYLHLDDNRQEYVSFVDDDDDSFPQHRVSVTLPPFFKMLKYHVIIGSSHGLICLWGVYSPGVSAVIWNPSIRKAVYAVVPYMTYEEQYRSALGFGVCRKTTDAKIVIITRPQSSIIDMKSVDPWLVEVFTLSTRAWRSPYSGNFPSKSIKYIEFPVVVDRLAHRDSITVDDGKFTTYRLIISFDMTSEEFGEVNLPDRLAHGHYRTSMYQLRESLVVIESGYEADKRVYHVWMMVDAVPKSFQKLYTMSSHSPDASLINVRGFRKTGQPLIELRAHPGDDIRILAAYEPHSKSISNLGINGRIFVYCYLYSCMETLLLL